MVTSKLLKRRKPDLQETGLRSQMDYGEPGSKENLFATKTKRAVDYSSARTILRNMVRSTIPHTPGRMFGLIEDRINRYLEVNHSKLYKILDSERNREHLKIENVVVDKGQHISITMKNTLMIEMNVMIEGARFKNDDGQLSSVISTSGDKIYRYIKLDHNSKSVKISLDIQIGKGFYTVDITTVNLTEAGYGSLVSNDPSGGATPLF